MAILVEAFSVVVRYEAIEQRFSGGWSAFLNSIPNQTFCSDGVLARVGFMSSKDVETYSSMLEKGGLVFKRDGQAVDFAVLDQRRGPTIPAPWLEFGKIVKFDEKEAISIKIAVCCLAGQTLKEIALPKGWKYKGSLSDKSGFEAEDRLDDRLKFLRHENGLDVYMDLWTGKEVFSARLPIAGEGKPTVFTQLEKIFHETLKIEAQMQPLLALRDEHALVPLFNRLNSEFLPAAVQISEDIGREISFAHFTLGLILRILHQHEEAEQAFRRANALQPGVINTLQELVRCLGEQEKNQEALVFAREAVEVEPMDAGAWGNLAMCLIQCKEREEARRAIDYAIDLDPQNSLNCYIRDNFEGYFK